ncbi:MAG: FHA domain-containing protein, partial [Blastocatellia bacterium]
MWSGLDYGQPSAPIAEAIKEADMERIALVHLSGSKADQEDRFPLDRFKEITLGRDPASSVRFSEETEVMVGRQHARITRNPALPSMFFITDLDSRNGTFVNQQRISGAAVLKPGDVVQCGIGGPEFRFDVEPETDQLKADPPPRPTLEQTRAQSAGPDLPSIASFGDSSDMTVAPADASSAAPAEGPARKRASVVSGVLIGLIALVAGYVGYRSLRPNNLSQAEKPRQSASPEASAESVQISGGAAEAEKDEQRAAWRIEVTPYLALGGGRPGNAASDFNKPAGVAFSPAGLLFATDDGNRRVQVWDVKTGSRLGEFGHDALGGEIAGIAIAPDNQVLITDQARGLAYAFTPPQPGALAGADKPLGPYAYQFKGVRFGDQGFTKLGGVAVDSKGRVYVVDANSNDVLRFAPDGAPDKTWKFEKARADGDTYLHGSEGLAIDEAGGDLFVASEKDAVVEVFDRETGAYKNRIVGAGKDASG